MEVIVLIHGGKSSKAGSCMIWTVTNKLNATDISWFLFAPSYWHGIEKHKVAIRKVTLFLWFLLLPLFPWVAEMVVALETTRTHHCIHLSLNTAWSSTDWLCQKTRVITSVKTGKRNQKSTTVVQWDFVTQKMRGSDANTASNLCRKRLCTSK